MSKRTKQTIVASFTKILRDKPFDKITVNDISDDCGISRMTFYYHFHDIYDMIDWAVKEKLKAVIAQNYTYDTWVQGFKNIFKACLLEKSFFIKITSSMDLRIIEQFLYAVAKEFMLNVIKTKEGELGITLNDTDENLIGDLFVYQIVGVFLNWMSRGMRDDPDETVENFCFIIKGSLNTLMLKAAAEEEAKEGAI